jgi:hypothetical protein
LPAGKLLVFEGTDGVGKTTLVGAVHDAVLNLGVRCERFAFPGAEDGTVGRLVYELHHTPDAHGVASITPASLQALHVAAHVDAIDTSILPALSSGAYVLLDRFWWSTWAYGLAAGVPAEALRSLIRFERFHWGAVRPTAILHLVRRKGGVAKGVEAEYERLAVQQGRFGRVIRMSTAKPLAHSVASVLEVLELGGVPPLPPNERKP